MISIALCCVSFRTREHCKQVFRPWQVVDWIDDIDRMVRSVVGVVVVSVVERIVVCVSMIVTL